MLEMHRGSMAPICIGSPWDSACSGLAPSVKAMSMRQLVAEASVTRQTKVGGVISCGKMEPSSG